ncbi:hypothetical protein RBA41_31285 [Massilia sp. CCM 9210]|uniref:hypothetical protein n=1 Tax=Massilia scottii TaxID=3057166 RepID=UPI0027963F9D|nr:hypothetical protein [Massilia sp. CCM 9210]MDQ1817794.1 hypothetical protein [Massilia sp. CCM 9210]
MTQQDFLRDAKAKLGLTWADFAQRIGAPETTMRKWTLPDDAKGNAREMPSTVWALVREILDHEALKARHEKLLRKVEKSC